MCTSESYKIIYTQPWYTQNKHLLNTDKQEQNISDEKSCCFRANSFFGTKYFKVISTHLLPSFDLVNRSRDRITWSFDLINRSRDFPSRDRCIASYIGARSSPPSLFNVGMRPPWPGVRLSLWSFFVPKAIYSESALFLSLHCTMFPELTPDVQRADNTIQWINRYLADKIDSNQYILSAG